MITPYIRWMIRRDMADVLLIENRSFEFPWTEPEFIRTLGGRNCIGLVAEVNEQVIGYIIYELQNSNLCVLNMAVHPEYRRKKVGKAFIDTLIKKSSARGRSLSLEVSDENLSAHLFLKNCGFVATNVLKCFYSDNNRDAYHFEYPVSQPKGKEECFVA